MKTKIITRYTERKTLCKTCGKVCTSFIELKECDPCSMLRSRIKADISLAKKILKEELRSNISLARKVAAEYMHEEELRSK